LMGMPQRSNIKIQKTGAKVTTYAGFLARF
jgi:hypothetical protein